MKLFHPTIYKHLRSGLFLILLVFSHKAIGQKVVRNAAGDKIIQYEDGSWRYFEGRDSMLESDLWEDIRTDQNPIEPLPTNVPLQYDYRLFQKYISAAVQYESEMLDKVDQSSNEAHSLEDKLLSMEESGDPGQIEKVKIELEALNDRRQNDQRLLSYARSLIKKILKVGKSEKYVKLAKIYVPGLNTDKELDRQDSLLVQEKTGESKVITTTPENEVKPKEQVVEPTVEGQKVATPDSKAVALSDSTPKQEGEEKIDNSTSENPGQTNTDTNAIALSEVQDQNKEKEEPKEEVNSATEVPVSPANTEPENTSPVPPDLELQPDSIAIAQAEEIREPAAGVTAPIEENVEAPDTSQPLTSQEVAEPDEDLLQLENNDKNNTLTSYTDEPKSATPGQLSGIIANTGDSWFSGSDAVAPEYNCEFTFHGIDDFTNTMKKEMKEELFFSYTDERLKPYLKDNDYVVCKGYLTSISGGFRYLTLIFTIASKNATREYGYIKTGSLLNLKLLDGETVSLFTQSENQGILEPKSGYTTYKVRYPIDYQKEKILQKSGVDKVRVVWSSGYEDYEVYNIDFFLNQLNCLNNK